MSSNMDSFPQGNDDPTVYAPPPPPTQYGPYTSTLPSYYPPQPNNPRGLLRALFIIVGVLVILVIAVTSVLVWAITRPSDRGESHPAPTTLATNPVVTAPPTPISSPTTNPVVLATPA